MRPRLSSHYTGSILCTLGIKRGPNRADLDNRSRNSVYFGLLLWIPAQNSARGSSILNGFMACSQNYVCTTTWVDVPGCPILPAPSQPPPTEGSGRGSVSRWPPSLEKHAIVCTMMMLTMTARNVSLAVGCLPLQAACHIWLDQGSVRMGKFATSVSHNSPFGGYSRNTTSG